MRGPRRRPLFPRHGDRPPADLWWASRFLRERRGTALPTRSRARRARLARDAQRTRDAPHPSRRDGGWLLRESREPALAARADEVRARPFRLRARLRLAGVGPKSR